MRATAHHKKRRRHHKVERTARERGRVVVTEDTAELLAERARHLHEAQPHMSLRGVVQLLVAMVWKGERNREVGL